MEIALYCPENLDIGKLMEATPTASKGIKHDHLIYIIHCIILQRACHDDEYLEKLGKQDGFTPLNAKKLEQKIPSYRRHLNFLLSNGIIECDEHYVPKKVSKGYKLKQPYRTVAHKRIVISDFVLKQKIKPGRICNSNKAVRKHPYLLRWFRTEKLHIDVTAAFAWVNDYEVRQIGTINRTYRNKTRRLKETENLIETCKTYKILITRIAEHDYFYHADETGYRLHTNLTNLPKELRRFITYDNQPMVSIDIRNSQPYMLLALLNRKVWEEGNNTLTIKQIHKQTYRKRKKKEGSHNIIMFVDSLKALAHTGFQETEFRTRVINGTLYEYLRDIFEGSGVNLGSTEIEKRNRVKKMFLTLLFDDDRKPYNRKQGSPSQVFRQKFPSIAKLIAFIKQDDYRNLAILLQRMESTLLLGGICRRISKEKPHIPLFTIHDNVVTTVGYEDYVASVMKSELEKAIGMAPALFVEYWGLQKQIISAAA